MKRLCFALSFLTSCTVFALQPPSPDEIEQYRLDGSLARRVEEAKRFGNHLVKPWLAQRTAQKLRALAGDPEAMRAPLPAWRGMPTEGTNHMLVFLIDFSEYPHHNSHATISNKLFGVGSPGDYPKESLQQYYVRSSYGKLVIEGTVLDWYRMNGPRNWYTNSYGDGNLANCQIVDEVATYYDGQVDYSRFDNDGDGRIDYVAVIWAGETGPWSSFWWAYSWSLFAKNITKDGVRFYDFTWQWEGRPVNTPFRPFVIIHETGHMVGIPDYYDYDENVGPDGGVGRLDMMDMYWGDHNCFSKFIVDWLTPTIVPTGGLHAAVMRASAAHPDAVLIFPGAQSAHAYAEYFMIQNRTRMLNDDDAHPNNGLLIWHVDARTTANGSNFRYDNSYTDHKLLRLMEADGREDIEAGYQADAGDYYNGTAVFSSASFPNSRAYSGADTRITVSNISPTGETMTADFTYEPVIAAPLCASGVTASDGLYTNKVRVSWLAQADASGYGVVRHFADYWPGANVIIGTNLTDLFFDDYTGVRGQKYYYWVRACNAGGWSRIDASTSRDSGFSSTASAPPPVPGPIDASDGTVPGCIMISWAVSESAGWYTLHRAASADLISAVEIASVTTNVYLDTNAVPGQVYHYWATAGNAAGTSEPTSPDTGYVAAGPPPAMLSASDNAYSNMVRVTWNPCTGAAGYVIHRSRSGSIDAATVLAGPVADPPYDDTNVAPGRTYLYWMKTSYSNGWSALTGSDSGFAIPIELACPLWKVKQSKKKGSLTGTGVSPALGPYFAAGWTIGMRNADTGSDIDGPNAVVPNKKQTIWKYKRNGVAIIKYSTKKSRFVYIAWKQLPPRVSIYLVAPEAD